MSLPRTKYNNRMYLIVNTVQTLNSPLYFSLSPYIIPGNDMHTFRVQAKGIQLNVDTSCMSMHISDKPDSKALC